MLAICKIANIVVKKDREQQKTDKNRQTNMKLDRNGDSEMNWNCVFEECRPLKHL